jgi:hypothetical protein
MLFLHCNKLLYYRCVSLIDVFMHCNKLLYYYHCVSLIDVYLHNKLLNYYHCASLMCFCTVINYYHFQTANFTMAVAFVPAVTV